MSQTITNSAVVQQIADAVAVDPKVKGELYARYLETTAGINNAFEGFTSDVNPKTAVNGGVRSIFARKTDLKAGGFDTVNFQVLGPPGGPGVMGSQPLTNNTSSSILATYQVRVGWHRDGFFLDKETIEFLAAGRSLIQTTLDLLAQKMGILRQNHQMMRLIKSATSLNTYRPNNKASTDALLPTDTLSLVAATSGRARLSTIGGQPIFQKFGPNGSPVKGYLIFASDMAMLNIRNDDSYQVALAQGDTRGADENANFTGELVKWNGMPWYEQPSVDLPWDDYIGSPLLPKAKVNVAFSTASAAGACVLTVNNSNTKSLYFQFFKGYDYKFTADQASNPDSGTYYAWAVNPDGSVVFLSYTGSNNNGNTIIVKNILSPNGAGTSTKGAATVGQMTAGSTSGNWFGTGSNLPTGWTYADSVQVGAVIIQANAKGTQIGYGFTFGAMASCFAYGRVQMNMIEQELDFGWAKGSGYETIFGTGVTLNPLKQPVGYLLQEYAIEHEGYPTPALSA
jgi:hypothetical protein